ncbi:MAG: DUF1598 domain-containing protein [Pirellulaceae bacterium]|nr:DUF1598 domain-containing protein [Pirellulaceae bacterium]
MSGRVSPRRRWLQPGLLALLLFLLVAPATLQAGHRLFRNNSVGGVSIDTEGVLRQPNPDGRKMLLEELRKDLKQVPAALALPVEMRMVSLRRLEAACEHALRHNLGKLPDEVMFLGGLQRIQYIFVYPDQNDIVLAGPGEGWRVDEQANVVGVTTGRPVMRLDDLLIALRQVEAAHREGISCSIGPTQEGYRNLLALLSRPLPNASQVNTQALETSIKQAFGAQQIKLTGVPPTSHFARVMVAADYKMKRLAMKLDESPVAGFPSYLDMIKSTGSKANVNPRWWMACNYEPLARTEDGLAWEVRGPGVKVLTEEEVINEQGEVAPGGRNPQAERWAELMTDKYDELSGKETIFGELRNLMDMCVVAAVIAKHDLLDKGGCSLPLLYDNDSDLVVETWNAPKTVDPQVSFLRTQRGIIVTASGGVQIESWDVAARQQVLPAVASAREKALTTATSDLWWWQ